MAKKIEFDYKGRHFTLEFNARTVKEVQSSGFKVDEIGDKSLIMLPLLFKGAFLMHHRGERAALIEEILPLMGNKDDLYVKLLEMYNEPVEALIEEPDDSVKVDWTGNW
jgi:hypothetical protein